METISSSAFAPDSASYLEFATAILAGQYWDYQSALRTPLYPLLLAIFQSNIILIIIVQIIMGVVTIFVTYQLAKLVFNDDNIALMAGILLSFSLESITHSYYLLSETLFTLLFLLSIYFFIFSKMSQRNIYLILSGILLSLAVLTRPIALYFPIVIVAMILLEPKSWKSRLSNALVFTSISMLFIGGWMLRNSLVIGVPTTSTITSQNLLYYNAASLVADQTGKNEYEVRHSLAEKVKFTLDERKLPDTEANRYKIENELGKEIILMSPLHYAFIHLKSDLNNLLPDTDLLEIVGITSGQKGTLDLIKQQGLWAGIIHYFDGDYRGLFLMVPFIILLLITYIGAAAGTVILILRKRIFDVAILFIPIAYSLLLPGSPSNPRFRVPVMPFLVILAAFGLIYTFTKWRILKPIKT